MDQPSSAAVAQHYAIPPESAVHLMGKGLVHVALVVAKLGITTLGRLLGRR